MKISLNPNEIKYLTDKGINIDVLSEYNEDEVFDIVDKVMDIEIFYAQDADSNKDAKKMAAVYGNIADKIQNMIPD